jgi:hypothetical protein
MDRVAIINDISYKVEHAHLTEEELARSVEVPVGGEATCFVLPGREGGDNRAFVQLYDEDQIPGFHELIWSTRDAALKAYEERPLAEAGKSSS